MRKIFLISAFIFSALANSYAQNIDSLINKTSTIKIDAEKKPVYVVDGVKQANYIDFKLSGLKPENIKEISILKNEDAIKLFGVEATDGVILITTKQGSGSLASLELKNKLSRLNIGNGNGEFKSLTIIPKTSSDSNFNPNQSSFNNSPFKSKEPVYVLNGDKVEKSVFNLIDPNTIQSVTVLKNSSATNLYGLEAINGVILISTKKVIKPLIKLEKDLDKN